MKYGGKDIIKTLSWSAYFQTNHRKSAQFEIQIFIFSKKI